MFLDRIVYWSLLYEEKVWYTFLVNIISCSTAGFSEIVSTNISEIMSEIVLFESVTLLQLFLK